MTISAGSLTVASLTPTDTADVRRWVGVQGSGLTGTLAVGDVLTGSVTGLSFGLNRATGAARPVARQRPGRRAAELDDHGRRPGLTLTDGTTTVAGTVTVSIAAGLLTGTTTVALSSREIDVDPAGQPSRPPA